VSRQPDVYTDIGRHIRALRRQHQLTLAELGERSGLGPAYIGQIERDVKKASLRTLAAIAEALGVPVAKLFMPVSPMAVLPIAKKIDILLGSSTKEEQRLLLSALRHLAKELKRLR